MFASTALNAEEARRLLDARRLPGRLSAAEAAVVLGFAAHDIPILVAKGMIKPLGKPAPNAIKYFASAQITQFSSDPSWLDRATAAIAAHWRLKNHHRSTHANH